MLGGRPSIIPPWIAWRKRRDCGTSRTRADGFPDSPTPAEAWPIVDATVPALSVVVVSDDATALHVMLPLKSWEDLQAQLNMKADIERLKNEVAR